VATVTARSRRTHVQRTGLRGRRVSGEHDSGNGVYRLWSAGTARLRQNVAMLYKQAGTVDTAWSTIPNVPMRPRRHRRAKMLFSTRLWWRPGGDGHRRPVALNQWHHSPAEPVSWCVLRAVACNGVTWVP